MLRKEPTNNMLTKSTDEKKSIIDLQKFKLFDSTLYIEGVGILIGQCAKEYSDIEYQLIIKGVSNQYVKRLAKAHRPELTKLYAANSSISYDKCWFATPKYQGIDISEVPLGHYELLIEVLVNGVSHISSLYAKNAIHIKNSLFQFDATDSQSKLVIKQSLKNSAQEIINAFQSKFGFINQEESKLKIIYPNGNIPISVSHDLLENHIEVTCTNAEILADLCTFLAISNSATVSLPDNTRAAEVILPLLAKVENFITSNTKYSKEKFKVNGYYRDEHNNTIQAPFHLHNVQVQFYGKNNQVILHENANLKNTFIEFKGDNGCFSIGEKAGIFGTFRLGYQCNITIGNKVTSTNTVYVTCAEKTTIEIGDDCMFATNNQIRTDDSHPIYDTNTGKRVNPSKSISIGNHVWIAYGATILGGSNIGSGSVIGAYSLVKKSIPNNCIAAGVPAKVIREDVFWERPLLLNEADEKVFASEYLQQQNYINKTES